MVAARKRENQNRINDKLHLFRYSKENITVFRGSELVSFNKILTHGDTI